jgi:DNA-binding NtrC family response regulator
MKPNVLLVDDDPMILTSFARYLKGAGYDIKKAASLSEARDAVLSRLFDAVILDMVLPDGSGIDLISELKENSPSTAVVVVTGQGDIPLAVEAMRCGADNFLTKPVNMEELDVSLKKCVELSQLRLRDLNRRRLVEKFEPHFGKSPAMKRVLEVAKAAAEKDSPVIIHGETGSGKGVLARWIHDHSPRGSAPFVDVNCSSLSGDLLASELFGNVKGAFTSAVEDRAGLIEFANRGTLFLDEIGDMCLPVQAQFLKVIEEKSYRRLGEARSRHSDFRLIYATNKNLEEETQKGRFRKDFYYRINVLPIVIPPLRERPEDMTGLVSHILKNMNSPHPELSPEVMKLLKGYPWPGNVRELINVLERAFVLSDYGPVVPAHFPGLERPKARKLPGGHDLQRLEEEKIKEALKSSGNNMRKTAEALGISRTTLYRKLKKLRQAG